MIEKSIARCHECGTKQLKDNGIVIDGIRFTWNNYDVWFCNMEHKELWLERNQKRLDNDKKKANV